MRPRGHFRLSADQLKGMAGGWWFYRTDSVRGVRGVWYLMNGTLAESERARVERCGNVRITDGRIGERRRFNAVFVGERCFTDGEKRQLEIVW